MSWANFSLIFAANPVRFSFDVFPLFDWVICTSAAGVFWEEVPVSNSSSSSVALRCPSEEGICWSSEQIFASSSGSTSDPDEISVACTTSSSSSFKLSGTTFSLLPACFSSSRSRISAFCSVVDSEKEGFEAELSGVPGSGLLSAISGISFISEIICPGSSSAVFGSFRSDSNSDSNSSASSSGGHSLISNSLNQSTCPDTSACSW